MKRLTYQSFIHQKTHWYLHVHYVVIGACFGLLLAAALRALFSREVGLAMSYTGFWGALNQFIDEVLFYSEPGFIPTPGYIVIKRIVRDCLHTIVICVPLAIAIEAAGMLIKKISTSKILRNYSALGTGNPFKDSREKSEKLFYQNVHVYDALCNADNKMLDAFIEYASHMHEMTQNGFQFDQKIKRNDAVRLTQLEKRVTRLVGDEEILLAQWLQPKLLATGSFHPQRRSLYAKTLRFLDNEHSHEDSSKLTGDLRDMADTFMSKSFFFGLYEFQELLDRRNKIAIAGFILGLSTRDRLKTRT